MTKIQGEHWELIRDNCDTLYHYKTDSGEILLSLLVREDGGIEIIKKRGRTVKGFYTPVEAERYLSKIGIESRPSPSFEMTWIRRAYPGIYKLFTGKA